MVRYLFINNLLTALDSDHGHAALFANHFKAFYAVHHSVLLQGTLIHWPTSFSLCLLSKLTSTSIIRVWY